MNASAPMLVSGLAMGVKQGCQAELGCGDPVRFGRVHEASVGKKRDGARVTGVTRYRAPWAVA